MAIQDLIKGETNWHEKINANFHELANSGSGDSNSGGSNSGIIEKIVYSKESGKTVGSISSSGLITLDGMPDIAKVLYARVGLNSTTQGAGQGDVFHVSKCISQSSYLFFTKVHNEKGLFDQGGMNIQNAFITDVSSFLIRNSQISNPIQNTNIVVDSASSNALKAYTSTTSTSAIYKVEVGYIQ